MDKDKLDQLIDKTFGSGNTPALLIVDRATAQNLMNNRPPIYGIAEDKYRDIDIFITSSEHCSIILNTVEIMLLANVSRRIVDLKCLQI